MAIDDTGLPLAYASCAVYWNTNPRLRPGALRYRSLRELLLSNYTRNFDQSPQIANVTPICWILMKSVLPSGEKVEPANSARSNLGTMFFANAAIRPSGVSMRTKFSGVPATPV